MAMEGSVLHVRCTDGQCFGPQPFLAYKTRTGTYIHDNFDVQTPEKHWTYVFDSQTTPPEGLEVVAVGSAGAEGSAATQRMVL
jgi:hypothetical protein